MASDNTPSAPAKPKPVKSGPLDKFPAAVRDAHARFLATGDIDALDTVVLAIVRDHQPAEARAATPAAPPDSALLIGDLGFDSLALAEIVFFIEDLYQVSVSNEELMRITTVGELRGFIRIKVASSGASSQPPSS
jgi:acyl carrier protein